MLTSFLFLSGARTGSVTITTSKLSTNSSSNFGQSTGSSSESNSGEVYGQILETPNLRIYTFAELKSATKNFKPDTVLGEGGFGTVYKGWVDEKTLNPTKVGLGMVIAVKKLNHESVQGLEQWQVSNSLEIVCPLRFAKFLLLSHLMHLVFSGKEKQKNYFTPKVIQFYILILNCTGLPNGLLFSF